MSKWYKVMNEDSVEFYDGSSLKEARKVAKENSKNEAVWIIDYGHDVEIAIYENGKEI